VSRVAGFLALMFCCDFVGVVRSVALCSLRFAGWCRHMAGVFSSAGSRRVFRAASLAVRTMCFCSGLVGSRGRHYSPSIRAQIRLLRSVSLLRWGFRCMPALACVPISAHRWARRVDFLPPFDRAWRRRFRRAGGQCTYSRPCELAESACSSRSSLRRRTRRPAWLLSQCSR